MSIQILTGKQDLKEPALPFKPKINCPIRKYFTIIEPTGSDQKPPDHRSLTSHVPLP